MKLINIIDLSALIVNLELIPKQHHAVILDVMASRLSELSSIVLTAFMMDCIVYNRKLVFNHI